MYRHLINKKSKRLIPGFILFSLFIFSISGCKMSGDALAEYNGGKITRGQMYEWLEVRGISKEATVKKKSIQKTKLRQMVLDALTVQEAIKTGFDKSDDFQKKLSVAQKSFHAGYMQKDFSKNGKFSEEAVAIRLIKFTVQNPRSLNKNNIAAGAKEIEAAFKLKNEAALKALKEIESGVKFEEAAKKYSDDMTNKNGGYAGYITREMREPEFTEAVFKLNKGEYTKEPIKTGNALYLVLVEDKTTVTDENIDSIFKDKGNASVIKKRLVSKGITTLVDKLKQAQDVTVNLDVIEKGAPAAVIFKVAERTCTVQELNDHINKIYNKAMLPGQKPVDLKTKKDVASRLLSEELLARELIRTNVDKTDAFKKEWSHYYNHILSTEYKNSKISAGLTVTEQEIKEEYDKNKSRSYVKREMQGKKMVQSFYQFSEVKEKIRIVLTNKKKMQSAKAWEEKLLSENSFKINENKLEGD